MSNLKRGLGVDVLTATRERIAYVFDHFNRIYLSFSAGKDSTVMTHLVLEEARARQKPVGLLLIDLEAQYTMTIQHAEALYREYADIIEPFWIALPMALRNAVSMYEPKWMCWDPEQKEIWVRTPSKVAITDESYFPFFHRGMEFEEFVEEFGHWYARGELTCCFVGIRTDESLNRFRTIMGHKSRFQGKRWTTYKAQTTYNAYPIYDWKTQDIWTYLGKFQKSYNPLYDLMQKAGVPLSQQRICQPYGDDQRKGLWLFHLIEPETWGKVIARVNGANSGALYAKESGNILGRIKISKPDHHTWETFAKLLLTSLPDRSREHFENKITMFLHWYEQRGYPNGIPDEAEPTQEAKRAVPSWRRICKAILRNDYWCKGLSFSQHKSESFVKYQKIMKKRRQQWRAWI